MSIVTQPKMWMRSNMVLRLCVGVTVLFTWAEVGMAKPKGPIYKHAPAFAKLPETS